jgi:hypothetical protein
MPTIAVRDLEIQRARTTSCSARSAAASTSSTTTRRCAEDLEAAAKIYPIEDAWIYVPGTADRRLRPGQPGRRSFYTAKNPPFGAVFNWADHAGGPLVLPGTYEVTLEKEAAGEVSVLAGPERFDVVPLETATIPVPDRGAVLEFQRSVASLRRSLDAATRVAGEAGTRLANLRAAVRATPGVDQALMAEIDGMQVRLDAIQIEFRGDRILSRLDRPVPPSISGRLRTITGELWNTTSAPTGTQREQYRFAGEAFERVLPELRALVEEDIPAFEARLDDAGAPWTPGRRVPDWKMR